MQNVLLWYPYGMLLEMTLSVAVLSQSAQYIIGMQGPCLFPLNYRRNTGSLDPEFAAFL